MQTIVKVGQKWLYTNPGSKIQYILTIIGFHMDEGIVWCQYELDNGFNKCIKLEYLLEYGIMFKQAPRNQQKSNNNSVICII